MFRYTFKNTLGTFLAFKTNDQAQKFCNFTFEQQMSRTETNTHWRSNNND